MTLITQPFFIIHTTQPPCHFNTHIHVFLVESGVVENAVRVSDLLGHGLRLHSAVNTRQSSQQLMHTAVNTRQSSQQLIHSVVNTRQSSQQLPAQCSQHKRSQQLPAQCSQHETKQSTAACTVQSTQDRAVNSDLHSAVNKIKIFPFWFL